MISNWITLNKKDVLRVKPFIDKVERPTNPVFGTSVKKGGIKKESGDLVTQSFKVDEMEVLHRSRMSLTKWKYRW